VSRHFPGYRIFGVGGKAADETIGLLLAQSLDSEGALESFRQTLASPGIASAIISKLLPRVSMPVNRGKYIMSENMIVDVTSEVLTGTVEDSNVISAIAHVITRVLSNLGLVLEGSDRKITRMDQHYALTMKDIKRVVLIESLRDIFSEARIAEATKRLDQDVSPNLIAEAIANMLRHASHSIPEIRLRLEQLDIVQSLVQYYYRAPEEMSNTMRASTTLASLAGYANFLADAVVHKVPPISSASNTDMREACSAILTVLQSAPSIEAIPLSKFAEHFGIVPCSAPDGIYRGLVAYLPLMQTSKLDVVNVYQRDGGAELALIPTEYVPATTIASEINRTVLAPEAIHGLANLVADEIAMAKFTVDDLPTLRTIGMTDNDLVYLAMAQAEIVAITKTESDTRPISLVYAARVSEYWRTRLNAATPSLSYFADPQSLLIYQSGAEEQLPTPLPVRMQSLDLSAAFDTYYQGNALATLDTQVAKPLTFSISIVNPSAESGSTTLNVRVSPLELLVGLNPSLDREGAQYAMVKEPGVDRDMALIMSLASAFSGAGPQVVADKARSWLVETLTPLATHPAVTRVAVRALNQAVIAAELDARRLAPQYKEAVVKAYFGTLLALLVRFGKIDEKILEDILANLPVSALSVKAALSLATMPTALDANQIQ
jgi:hypothetical protein